MMGGQGISTPSDIVYRLSVREISILTDGQTMRWLSTAFLPFCLLFAGCTSGSYDLMETASVSPRFQDTDPQDFAKMATAISQLRTGTDPDAVCPAEWCREQLGIPKDERSDDEKPKRQPNPFDMQNYGGESDPLADQKLASEKEMAAAAHELAEAVRKG